MARKGSSKLEMDVLLDICLKKKEVVGDHTMGRSWRSSAADRSRDGVREKKEGKKTWRIPRAK